MKAKLIIDGKEFDIEMDDNEAKAMLSLKTLCEKKKTGYERVNKGEIYYALHNGKVTMLPEQNLISEDKRYETADYYSDRTVAENNARADKLYRQLRRFAVEHRENKINWNDTRAKKWMIDYNHSVKILDSVYRATAQSFNSIYFDTYEAAQLAINTFKDELLWYFTEYKDSL